VSGCCNRCEGFFGDRFARRVAARYRRKGLDATGRRIVEYLASRGLEDATVLEVGGGIGELQLELLERGAARTVNLELSSAYEHEAGKLIHERGYEGRVDRRLHDIALAPVEPADVVVLNRVVCCYPDYERLLAAAADHARRVVIYSFPPRNPLSRALVAAENLAFRLRGLEFRTFTHPPRRMRAVLERKGLRQTFSRRGVPWRIAALERPLS
jgi:2-polyprenyl-3-methyl-5-hydroxy-6-metoxy-1,4-benzoquinol methylase